MEKLIEIASRYTPKVRDAILQAYRDFYGRVSERDVINILNQQGFYGLLDLSASLGDDFARNVTPVLFDAWQESGRYVARGVPKNMIIQPLVYETLPLNTITSAYAHRAELVQDISRSTQNAIAQAVERALSQGISPERVAQSFRSAIGLTHKQEYYVWNYRRQLERLDRGALLRQLRDARSDRSILRAIESGKPLSPEQIDSITERYRQRMVKFRAETIARSEALRAVNMGEYETLYAADEMGKLNPYVRRFWDPKDDGKTREHHIPIPDLNPLGVGMKEVFITPLGPMRYPLDPLGVAKNVIRCRCRVLYKVFEPGERIVAPTSNPLSARTIDALSLPDVSSEALLDVLY